MDMSFFPRTGEPLAAPRLDYGRLLAGLAARAKSSSGGEASHAAPGREASGMAGDLCLAAVILGRPGWRRAAQALGGGFSPDAQLDAPA